MKCISNLVKKAERIKEMTKINLMFIAMDCGKHGAELYRDPDVDNMTAMINIACHIVYDRFYGNSSKLWSRNNPLIQWPHFMYLDTSACCRKILQLMVTV